MGLFDGRSDARPRSSQTRTTGGGGGGGGGGARGLSPARSAYSTGNGKGYYTRSSSNSNNNPRGLGGNSSSSSFFGNFGGNSSSRGWFSGGASSSYYRRSPRQGYVQYLMHKLQRMLRDLWAYARRHPMKAFFAVVVPLLSAGGAIHGLLKQFGVRVPILDRGAGRGGGGYYGSSGYGAIGGRGGFGGEGLGQGGWMENAGSLMQIAKAFM